MGLFGVLRRDELVKMTIDHIEDKGVVIFVRVLCDKKICSTKT